MAAGVLPTDSTMSEKSSLSTKQTGTVPNESLVTGTLPQSVSSAG